MAVAVDRLFIDEKDRELYDRLQSTDIFKGKTRKEQFLFALGFAFRRAVKRPVSKREGFFLAKDMRPEDEALLNAVAVYDTKSLHVLPDKATVFKIAEEYAHAGIRVLVGEIESSQPGTFEKRLEKELHDMSSELGVVGG